MRKARQERIEIERVDIAHAMCAGLTIDEESGQLCEVEDFLAAPELKDEFGRPMNTECAVIRACKTWGGWNA